MSLNPSPNPTLVHPSASSESARPLTPGIRLGRWVLEQRLGDGATATVWSARHEQLGASVAIKVFHRKDLPFQTVLGEARAAAGIPSRHVIWVYDADTFDGHHAIVMELSADGDVAAQSLRDLRPTDACEAARWAAEAARGIAAAHRSQVFHKDVKPANILVHPSDRRAQITDFGLANPLLWMPATSPRTRHQAQATVALDDLIESPSSVVDPLGPIRGSLRLGTPEFMAPEQAVGLRRDLDPADALDRRHLVAIDVYGLGATLWYLLAGTPPYPLPGTDADTLTPHALMRQVVERPPPSARSIPGVPRRLARIVDKAMSRDPRHRYDSADALADDLDAWRTGWPTSLDRAPERLGVHIVRERRITTLIVALAVITGGSTWLVAQNVTRLEEQAAQIAAQRTRLEAASHDIENLERTHTSTTRVLERTSETLARTREALDQTAVEVEVRDRTIADRDTQLQAAADQLAAAEIELTAAAARQTDLSTRLGALNDEHRARGVELEATQVQLSRTENLLASSSTRASALAREVADLSSEVDQRTLRITALEAAQAAARQELEALRTQVEQARVRIRELRDENERLRAASPAPVPL